MPSKQDTATLMIAALLVSAAVGGLAASPVPGFRAPATPLFEGSPLVNVFSFTDTLYGSSPKQWTGADLDMFAGVTVDSKFFLLYAARGILAFT